MVNSILRDRYDEDKSKKMSPEDMSDMVDELIAQFKKEGAVLSGTETRNN